MLRFGHFTFICQLNIDNILKLIALKVYVQLNVVNPNRPCCSAAYLIKTQQNYKYIYFAEVFYHKKIQ